MNFVVRKHTLSDDSEVSTWKQHIGFQMMFERSVRVFIDQPGNSVPTRHTWLETKMAPAWDPLHFQVAGTGEFHPILFDWDWGNPMTHLGRDLVTLQVIHARDLTWPDWADALLTHCWRMLRWPTLWDFARFSTVFQARHLCLWGALQLRLHRSRLQCTQALRDC